MLLLVIMPFDELAVSNKYLLPIKGLPRKIGLPIFPCELFKRREFLRAILIQVEQGDIAEDKNNK